MQRWINAALALGMLASIALAAVAWRGTGTADTRLRPDVPAGFNPTVEQPRVGEATSIDPLASVIGDVRIGRGTFVAPFASIRGDEGGPVRIGSRANIQDGVVLHALATLDHGAVKPENLVTYNGHTYAIYVGDEVSLAPQSQVHGPALVGDRTFVGMQALIFRSEIGEGCVIEPGAKLIGVKIAPGRYVPAGSVITAQAQADALPPIPNGYAYATINDDMVHVNTQLADGYLGNGRVGPDEATPKSKPAVTAEATRAVEDRGGTDRSAPADAAEAPPTRTPLPSATTRPPATRTPTPAATAPAHVIGSPFPTPPGAERVTAGGGR